MPLLETKGAGSAQGFGLSLGSAEPVYIEQTFSTYLYTGNGSTQTITNGIDLAGEGGLVWLKRRDNVGNHGLFSSNFGDPPSSYLISNSSGGASGSSNIVDLLTNGFSVNGAIGDFGANSATYASWTFRKQPKFFDVVTYTGDGNYSTDTPAPYGRAIAHSLGSRPGFIVIKPTSTSGDWYVGARKNDTYWIGSNGTGASAFALNRTTAGLDNFYSWASRPMADETSFFPAQIGAGGSSGTTNDNGVTYVAYLFAHNAGGFGLEGTDDVISCGSFTTDGSGNATVTLGYEPQWFLRKRTDSTGNWTIVDSMRGFTADGTDAFLYPNLSNAEVSSGGSERLTSTGVQITGFGAAISFIYIAIRRGPMKVPTSGTEVYNGVGFNATGSAVNVTGAGFPPDLAIGTSRSSAGYNRKSADRLRGLSILDTNLTSSEGANGFATSWGMDGITWDVAGNGQTAITYFFRRAPGFFDVACYTGNGTNGTTITHNLGVAPELIIVKGRSNTWNWGVGCDFTSSQFQYLALNSGADGGNTNSYTSGAYFGGQPTTTTFTLATNVTTNQNANTYVAYLFASLAGISKVGKYTGTGTTKQIDCGFTNGARFVLIKRLGTSTDAGIGDWYVWDSARGIVSGNDPYLLLNSTAAEVTNTDYIDTYSAGFEISSTAPSAINANGGIFIFLAIA